jgi:hypothetical protein
MLQKKPISAFNTASRRYFIKSSAIGIGSLIAGLYSPVSAISEDFGDRSKTSDEQIKAFNIDYNWGPGGAHGFAKPGLWADADPDELMKWYGDLGCNVVHSFGVSCNGYAWYKNGITPEQPGLKYDFLTEMVKAGRKKNMKVFGYFCVGANNKWEQDHPDLCYGMDGQQIPFTTQYTDYLCASLEDAIIKTDMDGIMLDWFYNPGGGKDPLPPLRWMPCEQIMFKELMHQPFPGKNKITPGIELNFRRKAIDKLWVRIREITKKAKPDCIIWLTAYEVNSKEYAGSKLLKEVDWLMNEAGDISRTKAMQQLAKKSAKLITCLANWNEQDPVKIVPLAIKEKVGLYGFSKPVNDYMLPPVDYYLSNSVDSLKGDERNIAVLARTYNNLPLDYVKI